VRKNGEGSEKAPGSGNLTNRCSCRLRLSSGSKRCRRCGWLRVGESAAQLNSMLGSPNVWHRMEIELSLARSDCGKKIAVDLDVDTPCVYH
jgi:hypothetical protein